MLAAQFGPKTGPWLVRLAQGRDSAKVDPTPYVPRSCSREVTFQANLQDWDDVRREVVRVAERVAVDVVADGRPAVRVVVKVRYAPFLTRTHGQALSQPTSDSATIVAAAGLALDRFTEHRPVRLVGVRAEFGDDVPVLPEAEESGAGGAVGEHARG